MTAPRSTHGSNSRATSQQLPVTSNATRSDVNKLSANDLIPSGVLATRPTEQARRPRRSRPHKSRGAHPGRPHDPPISAIPPFTSTQLDCGAGEPAGQRHRPIRAQSSIQASRRGGRTISPGSKPIGQNGLPVSQSSALSRTGRTYDRPRTELDEEFHASTSDTLSQAKAIIGPCAGRSVRRVRIVASAITRGVRAGRQKGSSDAAGGAGGAPRVLRCGTL
jgi:hypothetical protein